MLRSFAQKSRPNASATRREGSELRRIGVRTLGVLTEVGVVRPLPDDG